jgi:hypothetical protein
MTGGRGITSGPSRAFLPPARAGARRRRSSWGYPLFCRSRSILATVGPSPSPQRWASASSWARSSGDIRSDTVLFFRFSSGCEGPLRALGPLREACWWPWHHLAGRRAALRGPAGFEVVPAAGPSRWRVVEQRKPWRWATLLYNAFVGTRGECTGRGGQRGAQPKSRGTGGLAGDGGAEPWLCRLPLSASPDVCLAPGPGGVPRGPTSRQHGGRAHRARGLRHRARGHMAPLEVEQVPALVARVVLDRVLPRALPLGHEGSLARPPRDRQDRPVADPLPRSLRWPS